MAEKSKLRKTGEFLGAGVAGATLGVLGTIAVGGNIAARTETTHEPAPEGLISLSNEQMGRVETIARENALNDYLRVRENAKDRYNGYGQLMATRSDGSYKEMAFTRFTKVPDGVEIGVEYVTQDGDEMLIAKLTRFATSSEEASRAVADGKLTTKEAQVILTDPSTKLIQGSVEYKKEEVPVIRVTATDQGVIAQRGSETYNKNTEDYDFKAEPGYSSKDALETFLNA